MKWLRKLIENTRPTYAHDQGFVWTLWETRWFGLGLVLRFRSDTHLDQRAEASRVRVVLQGEYLEHFEIPRTGQYEPAGRVPKGAYTYGNQFGLWGCRRHGPGAVVYEPVGRRGGVELLSARNQEDALIDYPNWMQHHDVVFDAERPVVMLMLTWNGVWKKIVDIP